MQVIYEVEVRFFEDGTEDQEEYFNFYFQVYPTKNDVLRAIEREILRHAFDANKESASGHMHKLYVQAKQVVSSLVADFTVGVCGGRPSYAYDGYVSVLDHNVNDNTAALG